VQRGDRGPPCTSGTLSVDVVLANAMVAMVSDSVENCLYFALTMAGGVPGAGRWGAGMEGVVAENE
jgi:hypothetical protein